MSNRRATLPRIKKTCRCGHGIAIHGAQNVPLEPADSLTTRVPLDRSYCPRLCQGRPWSVTPTGSTFWLTVVVLKSVVPSTME